MIKKFSDKHTLIFSIIAVIFFQGLLGICLFSFQPFDLYKYNIITVASYVAPIIFIILTIFGLKIESEIGFTSKGFFKGVLLGWFFILIGILSFVSNLDFSKLGSIESKTWAVLLPFTTTTLLIGIFEEFLCRGILINIFLKKWNCPRKAVIASSAIFGVAHITQLITAPGRPFGTAISIVLSFAAGVLFAAVYLRCKNIWSVVFLHTIFNWLSNIPPVLLRPTGELTDISFSSAIINIVIAVIFLFIGMFLIRKRVNLRSCDKV